MRLKVVRTGKELRPEHRGVVPVAAPRAARRGLRRRHHRHPEPRRAAARRHAHRGRGAAVHRPAVLRARDVPQRRGRRPAAHQAAQAPGCTQLGEEGAIQVFRPLAGSVLLLGAVGQLQFEVVAHRLEHEYGCKARIMPSRFQVARWVTAETGEGAAADERSSSASSTAIRTASPSTPSTRRPCSSNTRPSCARSRATGRRSASTRCASTPGWCSRSGWKAEGRGSRSACADLDGPKARHLRRRAEAAHRDNPARAPASPPFALPRPDPLEPAGGLAAAAVADAVGAVDRRRRLAGLAPARRLRARHDADAQRGLLRQRRRRPRVRPPCQAHRAAPGHARRGVGARGADARRAARARCLRAGADDQSADRAAVGRGARGDAALPLRQAPRRDAAGGARRRVQLRRADGLRRGAGRLGMDAGLGAGAGLVAAAGQPVLGAGLRHRVRDGRPRRRPEDRHPHLGADARPLRRRRRDGLLRGLPRRPGRRSACRSGWAASSCSASPSPRRRRCGTSR